MIPVTSIANTVQSVGSALADAAAVAASQQPKKIRTTSSRSTMAPRRRPSHNDPLRELVSSAPAIARTARLVANAVRNRRTTPGYAAPGRASSSAAKGPLDFLKDPKLSIEDKLLRLLAYQNEKWENEMQAKLDQLAEAEGGPSTSTSSKTSSRTSSKKSSGGALGELAGVFSKALGGDVIGAAAGALKVPGVRTALEKLGGPVLGAAASALGFPAAAPLLVKYGGKIMGAAAGAAASALRDPGSTSAKAGSTDEKKMSDAKRQQLTLEIQRLYEKQKEMFSLVSACLRVSHETRSAVIGNIR